MRKQIRFEDFDYTQPGAYFITVCTRDRINFFTSESERRLCHETWESLPTRYPTIRLDEFCVLPNHVHFIVWLNPPDPSQSVDGQFHRASDKDPASPSNITLVDAQFHCAPSSFSTRHNDHYHPHLGQVIRTFKAIITRRMRTELQVIHFEWQPNYYEHVIRTEKVLDKIREYIHWNPSRWDLDHHNPNTLGIDETESAIAKLLNG